MWAASRDGSIHIRDLQSGDLIKKIQANSTETTQTYLFYVNDIQVINGAVWTCSSDGCIRVYDPSGNSLVVQSHQHMCSIKCIAATRDGRFSWSGSEDWTILQRDGVGNVVGHLTGHTSWVRCLLIVTVKEGGGEDEEQTNGPSSSSSSSLPSSSSAASSLSPAKEYLWSGSDDGIRVWDVDTGECLYHLQTSNPRHHKNNSSVSSMSGVSSSHTHRRTPSTLSTFSSMSDDASPASSIQSTSHSTEYTVYSLEHVGDTVWSGGKDKCICVWSSIDRSLVKKWKAHDHAVCI